MKVIKYKKLLNPNAENEEQRFMEIEMGWNEANEEIAKKEAYGKPKIYNDGLPEPEVQPTESERIAELEEALELLLSGVTE